MAQASQDVQQLYSELINRMKQGIEMHEQLSDYYGFLNLPGYQKCHEYQMLCELLTYQKAKNMYMKEYNQLVQPLNMMNGITNLSNMSNNNTNTPTNLNYTNVIPNQWYNHTRYDVDANTKRNAVRDGFKRWIDYEKDTKQFLIKMGEQLEQKNEREAARKLDYLIDHVEKEIEHAEEALMSLENSGYDMNYILQQQEPLKAKYAEKIRKINSTNYHYRSRGSGNYANYNYDADDDEFGYRYYEMPNHEYYRKYM